MSVRVRDNQLTSLLNAVDTLVVAGLVLAYGVEPDDLIVLDAVCLCSLLDAFDVGVSVTLVVIAYKNNTDLEVVALLLAACA